MPRRVSLPAADDLFRPTSDTGAPARSAEGKPQTVRAVPDTPEETARKRASGRIRHDEKMTVYVTSEELLGLEQARLTLRATQGLAVDRGRLVREAIDIVLADFTEHGEQSMLVRRLLEE